MWCWRAKAGNKCSQAFSFRKALESDTGSVAKLVAKDAKKKKKKFKDGVWKSLTDFRTNAKWKDYIKNATSNSQKHHM